MKQKLRLGDSYALLANNHTGNKYKRKQSVCHRHKPGTGLKTASELEANSAQTRCRLVAPCPQQVSVQCGSNLPQRWSKLPSHIQECSGTGWNIRTLVRSAERNPEESCVWTHAKAPARYGLGLALGMAVLLLQMMCLEARAQRPEGFRAAAVGNGNYILPTVTSEPVTETTNLYRILKRAPDADLDRFPARKYHVETGADFRGLRIGDTIPEAVWNLPLWVVNHPDGKDTVTLADYRDRKLLVLDFWAKWCAPCVESMDKWEKYAAALDGDVNVIGVHIDFDYKALPFSQQRGWEAPSVIGTAAYQINRVFFHRDVVSRMVWIRDGKLAAITSIRGYDLGKVRKFANGETADILTDTNWTYLSTNESKTDLN